MRDYKNLKVPRKYRATTNRVSVKRVEASRANGRAGGAGLKSAAARIFVLAVIACGGWLGWHAYRSTLHAEMFQIAGVDIKGVRHVSDENLKAIAGVFTGQNILRVDLDEAARRARANPWVREVRIHRSLPNRITMAFVERVPTAILDAGAARYLMDDEAVVIERLGKAGSAEWPLPVVMVKDCRPHPGEQAGCGAIAEALTLLAGIAERGGWELRDIAVKASSPESLSLVYAGHEFKFGSGSYAEKLRRLAEVMADVKQRNLDIAYVDLRPERQAAVMVLAKPRR